MISANLASIEARKDLLPIVVNSLVDQVDKVRIYANDYKPTFDSPKVEVHTGKDLTDNGKFAFLGGDEYYFTCDDDILYPDNYVENTLYYLRKYPNYLITYHGRKLLGQNLNYYHGHEVHRFNRTVQGNWEIDVPGTGVSAFHTSLIDLKPLEWKYERMSDLMVGLECAKQQIPILCVQHKIWWLKDLQSKTSIYKEDSKDCTIQNQIADEIYSIKNPL